LARAKIVRQEEEERTMIKFVRDEVQPASQSEKDYVKSLTQYAIEETIETDGISLYWSEPKTAARFSTQKEEIK